MIPKIIHQTGPGKGGWHPIWKECQSSWLEHFSDFKYVFWDDEDIRSLIENEYPEFLSLYDSFPHHIMRVDFVRYCILHSYGGIYADLDFYCYKNFYNSLTKELYIVESWEEWGETVQNSLMISTKNHNFWKECMNTCKFLYKVIDPNNFSFSDYVLHSTGPRMLLSVYDSSVEILPKEIFNPQVKNQFNYARTNLHSQEYKFALDDFYDLNSKNDEVITRHYLTGTW